MTVPTGLHVTPVLYEGMFDTQIINEVMQELERIGSVASPSFMRPEGIVIFHHGKVQTFFKKTFEKDAQGKGE